MNLALQNFWKHPKTTITGFLGALSGFYFLLMTDPDYLALRNAMPVKWAGRISTAMLAVKLVMNGMSKDTGREEAKLPGSKQPVMVDAHEVPDDPSEKVVAND